MTIKKILSRLYGKLSFFDCDTDLSIIKILLWDVTVLVYIPWALSWVKMTI